MPQFKWARRGGYECSSKGDARFSALNVRLPDGRTIDAHVREMVRKEGLLMDRVRHCCMQALSQIRLTTCVKRWIE